MLTKERLVFFRSVRNYRVLEYRDGKYRLSVVRRRPRHVVLDSQNPGVQVRVLKQLLGLGAELIQPGQGGMQRLHQHVDIFFVARLDIELEHLTNLGQILRDPTLVVLGAGINGKTSTAEHHNQTGNNTAHRLYLLNAISAKAPKTPMPVNAPIIVPCSMPDAVPAHQPMANPPTVQQTTSSSRKIG